MRRSRTVGRLILAGLALAAGLCGVAHAQAPAAAPPQVTTRSISDLEAAELLFQAGKLPEAKRVLTYLRQTQKPDVEVLFLLGMIAAQEKDYHAAIHLFRAVLVRQPDAVRARLELGRAFFLAKDYQNAQRQFQLALAGNLPPQVVTNINVYLQAIRQARSWSYNVSIAAAPDTNLNAGPAIQTINIFGLPFQLSDQARKQSGVGVSLDAGGEWAPALTPNVRLRLGFQAHTLDYASGEFDDSTVSGYVGPRFVVGRWDVSPLATYYRRWYGGAVYNQGSGGSLQATYYATRRVVLSGTVSGQYIDFGPPAGQSGPAISSSVGAAYTLSSSSFISAQASVARQWAGLTAYSNTALQLQFGYYRDLPHGFSVSLQPSWVQVRYDGALAAFRVPRVDNQLSVQVAVLNRRLDVLGFTPRIAYVYTNTASNIPLYAFDRNRIEVGLTHLF